MEPDEYAFQFQWDLAAFDLLSERSRYGDEGGIGASNFGCREEMRRILTRSERTDSPSKWAAIVGSYVDQGAKAARKGANPNLIIDVKLPVTLYPVVAGRDGYKFFVSPDEIDPDEPSCTDLKTKDGLAAIRRALSDEQYRFQRHIQYLAAWQNGLVPEQGIVRNVFVDRSGKDDRPHVEQEPFSLQVIEEVTEWLNDVLYAVKHNEEAMKDKPRVFCKDYCAFYTACRGPEIETEKITDPQLAEMVDTAGEADLAMKANKQLKDELFGMGLKGLTGETSRFRITSTWVNAGKQTPHWRTELEALPTTEVASDSAA